MFMSNLDIVFLLQRKKRVKITFKKYIFEINDVPNRCPIFLITLGTLTKIKIKIPSLQYFLY